MAQAYSADLRIRAIQVAANGLSPRQVAERYEVGVSTAILWISRFCVTGEIEDRRQGKRFGSRLDAHEAFILALADDGDNDITLRVKPTLCLLLSPWRRGRDLNPR